MAQVDRCWLRPGSRATRLGRSRRTRLAKIGNLVFKQGIGQLETLMFVGVRIEDHERAGAETFDLADVVLAKPAPLIRPRACAKTCRLPALLTWR